MSAGMQMFSSKDLAIILIDESFLCECEGCTSRKLNGGVSFLLFGRNIWSEYLSMDEMKRRFETLNPCIGISQDLILPNIRDCLSEGSWSHEVDTNTNRLVASFEYVSEEFSLHWCLEANEAQSQMVMCHLVAPLFVALEESLKREKVLCRSLDRFKQQLQLSGTDVINRGSTEIPLTSLDDQAELYQDKCDEEKSVLTYSINESITSSFNRAALSLKKKIEIPKGAMTPAAKPTSLPSAVKANTLELEKQRHEELQRKLAREMEKSKAKRVKKSGILRK